MANFIPRLKFGIDDLTNVIFDTPPEGDPQGETLGTNREQIRSLSGQLFTSDLYDYTRFTLKFVLQSNAVALKLKSAFKEYGLKGETFIYYPHSDDDTISFSVELDDNDITFNRDYPDGQGGFLWSFEFSLTSVDKTAPRVVRFIPPEPPAPPSAIGAVRNLRTTNIGQTLVDLAWDEPTDTGGLPIQDYDVLFNSVTEPTVEKTEQLTGLVAGTDYSVQVRARNTNGVLGPYETLSFTTEAASPTPQVPNAPVLKTVFQETGDRGIYVTYDWPTGANAGTVTGVRFYTRTEGETSWTQTDLIDVSTVTDLSLIHI